MAIRWLMDAYYRMNMSSRENLVIVPVNISIDRIYENTNLATEMINGKKYDPTMFSSMQKMWSMIKDEIGDIYVKYLEPIHVGEYLKANA